MTAQSILVVEADNLLRDLIALMLARLGLACHVTTTGSGAEALALARRGPHAPDLVVLDLFLPRTNTLEVIRQIKDQPGMRRLPVIVISALGFSEVVRQAIAAGATDFILKPIDPAVLTDKARRALRPPATDAEGKP